jgi:hypothetical protein
MHRSGTSALAGSLKEAGVHLGQVRDSGFALNPKGLQEPAAILFMHEDLLRTSGGSWHEPPASPTWHPLHRAVRDLFIESRQGVPVWGFKDPRSLLVLEGWLDVLPHLECAAIFRHPAEVAASMHQRNAFELDKCFQLWEIYNRRLLALHAQLRFPVVEFVADPARMHASLRAMVSCLRLCASAPLDFFESRHRHFDRPDLDVPASALQLLGELRERALPHGD